MNIQPFMQLSQVNEFFVKEFQFFLLILPWKQCIYLDLLHSLYILYILLLHITIYERKKGYMHERVFNPSFLYAFRVPFTYTFLSQNE